MISSSIRLTYLFRDTNWCKIRGSHVVFSRYNTPVKPKRTALLKHKIKCYFVSFVCRITHKTKTIHYTKKWFSTLCLPSVATKHIKTLKLSMKSVTESAPFIVNQSYLLPPAWLSAEGLCSGWPAESEHLLQSPLIHPQPWPPAPLSPALTADSEPAAMWDIVLWGTMWPNHVVLKLCRDPATPSGEQ